MATVKGDPMAEFRAMQEQMNRLLSKSRERTDEDALDDGVWQPPVDIFEDGHRLVLKMDLPDVAEEDIRIEVNGESLVIAGERPMTPEGENCRYHRVERQYGPFRRTFALPPGIGRDQVEAACSRGVLRVVISRNPAGLLDAIKIEE